jgi:hypothetical protein
MYVQVSMLVVAMVELRLKLRWRWIDASVQRRRVRGSRSGMLQVGTGRVNAS